MLSFQPARRRLSFDKAHFFSCHAALFLQSILHHNTKFWATNTHNSALLGSNYHKQRDETREVQCFPRVRTFVPESRCQSASRLVYKAQSSIRDSEDKVGMKSHCAYLSISQLEACWALITAKQGLSGSESLAWQMTASVCVWINSCCNEKSRWLAIFNSHLNGS